MRVELYDRPVCDFCSSDKPAWRYPAETFVQPRDDAPAAGSEGDWLACDECALASSAMSGTNWRAAAYPRQ